VGIGKVRVLAQVTEQAVGLIVRHALVNLVLQTLKPRVVGLFVPDVL
jgi:hypothetical protein